MNTTPEASAWAGFMHYSTEHYLWLDEVIRTSQWSVPVVIAGFFLLGALAFPRTRRSVTTWWTALGLYVTAKLGERKMRKERERDQCVRGREAIMTWIEDEVDSGSMTRREANGWYRFFCRDFPDFKNCIEKISGREEIKSDLAASKDENGNVIPLPLPDAKKGGDHPGNFPAVATS